jgi:hypothetical protein
MGDDSKIGLEKVCDESGIYLSGIYLSGSHFKRKKRA